jgi:hypothetical protein
VREREGGGGYTKFNFPREVVPVIRCSEVMVTVSIMWEREECSFMLVQDCDLRTIREDGGGRGGVGTCCDPR